MRLPAHAQLIAGDGGQPEPDGAVADELTDLRGPGWSTTTSRDTQPGLEAAVSGSSASNLNTR